MSFHRVEEGGVVDDDNPWSRAPPEAQVEWDRDVAPLLEGMPPDTEMYFKCQTIGGHLYLSISFAVTVNRHTLFKSVLWTHPNPPTWEGGWMSNYGASSVAAELDWSAITSPPV